MAPRNSMRTKTWSFVKTIFPRKFGHIGRGTKARSRRQRGFQPGIKAICEVRTTENNVHSLFDFSKLVYYFI